MVKQNLSRAIGAIAIGVGLAITGCIMQVVFKNPLANSYTLGLSSDASLGSAVTIMLVPIVVLSVAQPVLVFVMCLLTIFIVYAISRFDETIICTETLVPQRGDSFPLLGGRILIDLHRPSDRM